MPYVKDYGKKNEINILGSADFNVFTRQISDTGVTANTQGRKIVPAGTVWPANDATAVGILRYDIDVTQGPQPGSVIERGIVLEARLPVVPAAAAKTALKGILFRTVTP